MCSCCGWDTSVSPFSLCLIKRTKMKTFLFSSSCACFSYGFVCFENLKLRYLSSSSYLEVYETSFFSFCTMYKIYRRLLPLSRSSIGFSPFKLSLLKVSQAEWLPFLAGFSELPIHHSWSFVWCSCCGGGRSWPESSNWIIWTWFQHSVHHQALPYSFTHSCCSGIRKKLWQWCFVASFMKILSFTLRIHHPCFS